MIIAAGACTLGLAIMPRIAADTPTRSALARDAARVGFAACLALIPASCLRLADQLQAIQAPGDPWTTGVVALLGSTMWGKGFLLGCAATVVLALGLRAAMRRPETRWPWWLSSFGAVALCVSPALQGHAIGSEEYTAVAVAADIMHVTGGALWLGTLSVIGWLGVAIPNADGATSTRARCIVDARLRLLVPWVPRVALPGAALLLSSGVLSGLLRLRALEDLWTSEWGRYVFAKAALACVIVGLGAVNWRNRGPLLHTDEGPAALRRTLLMELALAALVLLITAILVVTTPPGEL